LKERFRRRIATKLHTFSDFLTDKQMCEFAKVSKGKVAKRKVAKKNNNNKVVSFKNEDTEDYNDN
jgi:hypothetical protein